MPVHFANPACMETACMETANTAVVPKHTCRPSGLVNVRMFRPPRCVFSPAQAGQWRRRVRQHTFQQTRAEANQQSEPYRYPGSLLRLYTSSAIRVGLPASLTSYVPVILSSGLWTNASLDFAVKQKLHTGGMLKLLGCSYFSHVCVPALLY